MSQSVSALKGTHTYNMTPFSANLGAKTDVTQMLFTGDFFPVEKNVMQRNTGIWL